MIDLHPICIVTEEKSKTALVIDPARPVDEILKTVQEKSVKVVAILLSSGTVSRAARAAELSIKLHVPIYASQKILPALLSLPSKADRMGLCGVKVPTIHQFIEVGDRLKIDLFEIEVLSPKDSNAEFLTFRVNGVAL